MANNYYMPATRRTSNTGNRPSNDPLNLVKVSTNPLAVQAQETIHILEVQKNYKSEALQKDGNDTWISKLDDWKSKRKSIQPSSIRTLDEKWSSFEEPPTVRTSKVSSKDLLTRDDGNDDDGEDKTTKKTLDSKKLQECVSVSQEKNFFEEKSFTKEDFQDFKDKTDDVDGLKTYSEVKPLRGISKTDISRTLPSAETFKITSSLNTSYNSSGFSSTPKEATRRSKASVLTVERPTSSFVGRSVSSASSVQNIPNIPKVLPKKSATNFPSIPEREPIEVSKKKHHVEDVKTAQASIKKFNNIKNFFEQVSQNADSETKGPKPAARRGISSAVDPKKRTSLGPGVLERMPRSGVAIANDKEFIIDELFVDSSKNPLPKFQAKPTNPRFQMQEKESTQSIATPAKSPSKVYSFSTDEENATPVKADISMEDFKGMISLPTGSPSSIDVLDGKTEDEVFASPDRKMDTSISPSPRGTNKTNVACGVAEDEVVSIKSVDRGIKSRNSSTDKHVKEPISILKHNVRKDAKKMSFNDDEIQYKSDVIPLSDLPSMSMSTAKCDDGNEYDKSKNECNLSSFMETAGVDANRDRNSSKHDENVNSSASISSEKFKDSSSIIEHDAIESIEVVTTPSGQESNSFGKQTKETETHFTDADYSDLNSYSAKIDKLLEELKFIPTSSIESKAEESTTKSRVKDGKPVKSNDSEPKKSVEMFEVVDGRSCNDTSTRANVGQMLEKAFSRGKAMTNFESVVGDRQTTKNNNVLKSPAFPKVPPKPLRANSCKLSALFPDPSTPPGGKALKKDEKIESGVDLNTKASPNLLDVSASRAKVELSRRAKRRPPSIKGRSRSFDDLLDSATNLIVVGVVEDQNGFQSHSSEARDTKLHQREEESSVDDDDDDDDGDKPPSLPSCPPPIISVHDEARLLFVATESFDRTTALSLKETEDDDSDEDVLPESSA